MTKVLARLFKPDGLARMIARPLTSCAQPSRYGWDGYPACFGQAGDEEGVIVRAQARAAGSGDDGFEYHVAGTGSRLRRRAEFDQAHLPQFLEAMLKPVLNACLSSWRPCSRPF